MRITIDGSVNNPTGLINRQSSGRLDLYMIASENVDIFCTMHYEAY